MVTRRPVDREMENVPLLHLADVSGTLGPGHVIFHSYYGRLDTGSPGSRQLCANHLLPCVVVGASAVSNDRHIPNHLFGLIT